MSFRCLVTLIILASLPLAETVDAAPFATAARMNSGPLLDGSVAGDEAWIGLTAITGFRQIEPDEGKAATQKTEVFLGFTEDTLYVGVICHDKDPSGIIVSDSRRDSPLADTDSFQFIVDGLYDHQNGLVFGTNPAGIEYDAQVTKEGTASFGAGGGQFNLNWDTSWQVKTSISEIGWQAEFAIPFKSLRYRSGREQVWGLNIMRFVRRKNEISYLTQLPAVMGLAGIFQASLAATLVGLEVPEASRSLEIKPYAISELTTDRNTVPRISNDLDGAVGLDVKYRVTDGLVADLTVNTDFAQVEADEQQVNLTRFSLFFPEKREFFLENLGLFAFGGGGANTPILFHSRRIGLNQTREVPIDAGGRLTGRIGRTTLGVMNIQTDDAPVAGALATNFSVVRVKQDILRRSSIGALFTGRSLSTLGDGSSHTYGLDGGLAFYDNLSINTYWAKTSTPGASGDDVSYRSQVNYNGDRYGVELERLVVGDDFNPEVGFLRRDDMERSFGSLRFSPRPQSIASVRKLSWSGFLDHITNRAGVLETREAHGMFGVEFANSDQLNVGYTRLYELLDRPFRIAPDVTIPIGGYDFQNVRASLSLGTQRTLAGTLLVQHGSFFSGDRTTIGFSRGRFEVTPQLSVEPSVSFNRIDLPEGQFTTQLLTTRTTYTVSPLMFVSGLLQYNSSNNSMSTNLRLRWEYRPGSELFVVYNDQRDTLARRFPELDNRAFIIKVNRLFRF